MELAVRAAAASCSSSPSLHPPRVRCRLGRSPGLPQRARRVAVAAAAVALDPEIKTEQNDVSKTEVFACPVCYEPLIRKGPPGMNLPAIYRSGFKCSKCSKSFTSKDVFLDLTVTSGMKEYSELKPARTELFRSPLVSFLYEEGVASELQSEWLPWPRRRVPNGSRLFPISRWWYTR
uniref:Uncharacterized protein n=1 Tax=Triticum urartu TaxID=4572 RepID=A0A8R7RAP5_TRIUA